MLNPQLQQYSSLQRKEVPDGVLVGLCMAVLRILHFPPLPEVPEVLRGKLVVSILACYNGPASTAETVLQPIRTLVTPILDTFASMPYSRIATIANDAVESLPVLLHSAAASFQHILPADVDAILAVASNPASGLILFEIRHVGGGAYARLSEEMMAFHFSSNFAEYCCNRPSAVRCHSIVLERRPCALCSCRYNWMAR
jgi:hypothetical protein